MPGDGTTLIIVDGINLVNEVGRYLTEVRPSDAALE